MKWTHSWNNRCDRRCRDNDGGCGMVEPLNVLDVAGTFNNDVEDGIALLLGLLLAAFL